MLVAALLTASSGYARPSADFPESPAAVGWTSGTRSRVAASPYGCPDEVDEPLVINVRPLESGARYASCVTQLFLLVDAPVDQVFAVLEKALGERQIRFEAVKAQLWADGRAFEQLISSRRADLPDRLTEPAAHPMVQAYTGKSGSRNEYGAASNGDLEDVVLYDSSAYFSPGSTWIHMRHRRYQTRLVATSTFLALPFPLNLRPSTREEQFVPRSLLDAVNKAIAPILGAKGMRMTDRLEDWLPRGGEFQK